MIIDTTSNAEKYYCIHPSFSKAYEYIRSIDLGAIQEGVYEISDDLKAIVAERHGDALSEALSRFECHDKHIDIQLCIKGKEKIGWKARECCMEENGGYDPVKDVSFFGDAPDTYFQLRENQFVIFFPEDVHAPMIGEGKIKKIVLKVKIV